jgi:aryl-alcohol dehydrogenase-like predicted oxidoreductase
MTPSSLKLPFITYGTTRLGDTAIPAEARVKLALAAMQKGVYFHTSSSYGEAIDILAQAFKADPVHVPKLIIKIFGNSVEEMRGNVLKYIRLLGVPCIEVAQLCPGGDVWEDLARGGACYAAFKQMQAEGLVRHYVLEAFPWTSPKAYAALKAGHLAGRVDALIFYFNPMQRFASNELWDLAQAQATPFIALRTVIGGDVHQLRDIPGAAWKPYLQERAVQVAPIFERSGIATWPEFCVRFAASFERVITTVSSSSKLERLEHLLACAERRQPLPQNIIQELLALQRTWSAEVDVKSEPWSM